jgi:hypothetical protein
MARLRLATLLFLAIVLSACAVAAQPSAAPTSPASAPPTGLPGSAPIPSDAPTEATPPQPTAPIGENRDTIAEVVADGVRVRSLPSVADLSIKYEPLLRRGDEVFVIGGPVLGDGYDWFLVQSLIGPEGGPFGWVAFASREGEQWIDDDGDPACPALSRNQWLGTIVDEVLIQCFGDEEIEFEIDGGLSCFPDDPHLIDHPWLGPSCDMLSGDACGTCGLRIAAQPAAGIEIPDRDYAHWAVRGHFDDPAAAECLPGPDADPSQIEQAAVHACRTTFVLTSLERLGDAAS